MRSPRGSGLPAGTTAGMRRTAIRASAEVAAGHVARRRAAPQTRRHRARDEWHPAKQRSDQQRRDPAADEGGAIETRHRVERQIEGFAHDAREHEDPRHHEHVLKIERSGPSGRSTPTAAFRRAGFIDNHCTLRCPSQPGTRCAPTPAITGATSVNFRKLLAVSGAGSQGQGAAACPSSSPMSKRSRWEVLDTLEITWGDGPRISRTDGPTISASMSQSDRSHRSALLRDGRRVPEAHRHDDEIKQMAGSRARRHEGRRARPLGVAQPWAISTRRAFTSPRSGPTRRRSLRSAKCCVIWAPGSSSRAAATAPR